MLHGFGLRFLVQWSVPRNTSILLCQNCCFPLVYLLLIEVCSVILLLLFAQNRACLFSCK